VDFFLVTIFELSFRLVALVALPWLAWENTPDSLPYIVLSGRVKSGWHPGDLSRPQWHITDTGLTSFIFDFEIWAK